MRLAASIALLLYLACRSAGVLAQSQVSLADVLRLQPGSNACLNERSLRARVQHFLEARALAPELRVVVRTDAALPWFSVSRGGVTVAERRFEKLPTRCADLRDALGVAIAIAIDHAQAPELGAAGLAGASAPAGTPSAAAATAATAAPPTSPPTPPSDAPRDNTGDSTGDSTGESTDAAGPADDEAEPAEAQPDPRADAAAEQGDPHPSGDPHAEPGPLRLHAAGAVLFESVSAPLVAFGGGAEWQLSGLVHVALTALATPITDLQLGGAKARTQLLGARALLCLSDSAASLRIEGCAGVLAARVEAKGRGFGVDRTASMASVAVPLRLAARWPARSMLSLRAAIDAHLHVLRPRLRVRGGVSKSALPVGGAGAIEIVFTLP